MYLKKGNYPIVVKPIVKIDMAPISQPSGGASRKPPHDLDRHANRPPRPFACFIIIRGLIVHHRVSILTLD